MNTTQPVHEWVTVDQLAAELDVPVRTIYRWRNCGQGPRGAKFGKHLRFTRADINTWIETRYTQAG